MTHEAGFELVAELHRRQGEMYAGGPVGPVAELLAEDIVWHVPGRSPISGDHRGLEQVIEYLEKRRRLAGETMTMRPGEVISEGDAVAQFVEGSATLDGEPVSWRTIGSTESTSRMAGFARSGSCLSTATFSTESGRDISSSARLDSASRPSCLDSCPPTNPGGRCTT